jgi:hypothetical protein
MRRESDFPPAVVRLLAERAGYLCSVGGEATVGPATNPNKRLSDGIAAHITAAARGAPRFDEKLTVAERSSAENGIWVCSQHARRIDSDSGGYTVTLLRGLKRVRETRASLQLQRQTESSRLKLIDLANAVSKYDVFEALNSQPYRYETLAAARSILRESENRTQVLEWSADLVAEIWPTHSDVAGSVSVLLSNNLEDWHPTTQSLDRLDEISHTAISLEDWSQVGWLEPLTFALGAKGRLQLFEQRLSRFIEDPNWRIADAKRTDEYYAGGDRVIASIFRHWRDPFRRGVLRANDVSRIISVLVSEGQVLSLDAQRKLLGLLEDHAQLLKLVGASEVADSVTELVEAFAFTANEIRK